MRQFNNYEAVKVNNTEEAMEFLQYLEAFTNLRWYTGDKPTGISLKEFNERGFPLVFEVCRGKLYILKENDHLEDGTKIIPLSEFLKPKVTYTREQAEKVLENYNQFLNYDVTLDQADIAFLNHKFPKTTLEQVTEAVKDLGNFTIEQTSTGEIIISPINK